MSFIGSQLDALAASPEAEHKLRSIFRQIVFVLIILSVWISTRPFAVISAEGPAPSGDVINQLTFSSLAVLAFVGMVWSHRLALMPMMQPAYAVLMVWLLVSVVNSTFLAISFRAFAFTTIIMFLATALFVLPERLRQFQNMFLLCSLATMLLSYFGVIALPDISKHTDFDPFEPEHAGSWKGHYDHKNIAGAAMACFVIIGFYARRIERKWLGGVLILGGAVFLYFTKSKTALGLLPVALLLAWMAERYRFLPFRLAICVLPILSLLLLTIGSAFFPVMRAFNLAALKDPGFTGRYDIWRYAFEMLEKKLWFGYGYEAFWQTETTLKGESRLDLAWAVEKIVHGHNSYIDVALTTGVIGFVIVFYVFVIKPVLDYHKTKNGQDNQMLATMFLGIWLFISLDMCLETYYFRRSDPVWFTLLIAVIGLRFTASYRFDREPSQASQAFSRDA